MKRLIVSADDFGIHEAVNRGIAAGHLGGLITSTSVMAGGEAFADAVGIAGQCPALGIGVHLTLVGGGLPVMPPEKITSLLDGQGRFLAGHPSFIARYLAGRIRPEEVELELTAQLEKVVTAGLVPSHLDSHQHLHVLPQIFAIVSRLARRFSIRAIRRPAEPVLFFGGTSSPVSRIAARTGLSLLAAWSLREEKPGGLSMPDHFYGMLDGGRMNESCLKSIIDGLPEGSTEIMTHPGMDDETLAARFAWGYHWNEELQALTSPGLRESIERRAIQLITFREL